MKKNNLLRQMLVTICAMALIACVSVAATIAYFTDTETVTNTFTIGNVAITLDETAVGADGKVIPGTSGSPAPRSTGNEYHLIPGQTYDKDPVVHVDDESEDCWLFVKIENGIADIETKEADKTIHGQMTANGWALVEGASGIYAYEEIVSAGADVPTFTKFTIDGATVVNGTPVPATDSSPALYSISDYAKKQVKVTAYAIQAAGFNNSADAWDAYAAQNEIQ